MRQTHLQKLSVCQTRILEYCETHAVLEAYRKDDPESAAKCLDRAILHYCSKGNFRRAATHKQNLAEVYEVELGDNTRAAAAYEEAAGWYESVSFDTSYQNLMFDAPCELRLQLYRIMPK